MIILKKLIKTRKIITKNLDKIDLAKVGRLLIVINLNDKYI